MKNKIIVFALVCLFLTLLFFFPSESTSDRCREDEDCNNQELLYQCIPPATGCSDMCLGFQFTGDCEDKGRCLESCRNVCFGVNMTHCHNGGLKGKMDFILNRI